MTEYTRDEGAPDAAAVEQQVESAIGRDVAGVVVDVDGLQTVVLPADETLTDQQQQALTQEFGQSYSKRDRQMREGGTSGTQPAQPQ